MLKNVQGRRYSVEKLVERYKLTVKILNTLKEVLDLKEKYGKDSLLYKPLRDSVIRRFEYSIDSFWKFIKLYLQEKQNVTFEEISPRLVFRVATDAKLIEIKEYEIFVSAIADRNQTSHSYNELVAEDIIKHIPEYFSAMQQVIKRVEM